MLAVLFMMSFPKTMRGSQGATWYKSFPCTLLRVRTFPRRRVVGTVSLLPRALPQVLVALLPLTHLAW
jgi:hypothetical protein